MTCQPGRHAVLSGIFPELSRSEIWRLRPGHDPLRRLAAKVDPEVDNPLIRGRSATRSPSCPRAFMRGHCEHWELWKELGPGRLRTPGPPRYATRGICSAVAGPEAKAVSRAGPQQAGKRGKPCQCSGLCLIRARQRLNKACSHGSGNPVFSMACFWPD